MPAPAEIGAPERRLAIQHLFQYLDVRPGTPLLAYEPAYRAIVVEICAFASETGRSIEVQPVYELTPAELHARLSGAAKFVCAFNRRYRHGLSPHVRVMVERGMTLSERAYTLSDVSELFFTLFQVPPDQIVHLNRRILDTVRGCRLMRVTDGNGTDLRIPLSAAYQWVEIDGFCDAAVDLTVNLPPGEVATYSDGVEGVIRFRGGLLGTIPIGRKYGFIDEPITFSISGGRVDGVEIRDRRLERDLLFLLDYTPYTRTVCEIGLGTHPAIRSLIGLDYTYEEKHYGFHLGLGATLAQQNVERQTDHHLDLLFAESTIELDGTILFDGEYHV